MNPLVTVKEEVGVIYQLTTEDMKLLSKVRIVDSFAENSECLLHQVCIMQAAAMVTTDHNKDLTESDVAYTDCPICVSEVIGDFLIAANDHGSTERQRAKLKQVIPDILNTSPIKLVDRWISSLGDEIHWAAPGATEIRIEVRDDTREEYIEAERQRRLILERLDFHDTKVPMSKKIELVREAAAVYKTHDDPFASEEPAV